MKLAIQDDEGKRIIVPLLGDEITIGRKEGNTIRLTERNVSRNHAKLTRGNGIYFIEDRVSRYGTKINGNKLLKKAPLNPTDMVLIGDYKISLVTDEQQLLQTQQVSTATEKIPQYKLEEIANPFKLVGLSQNIVNKEYPLTRKEIKIGRVKNNNLVINHRSISRNHAKIVYENNVYKIVDLKSSNGIKVNGEPYSSTTLRNGDIVELGHIKLVFIPNNEMIYIEPTEAIEAKSRMWLIIPSIILVVLVIAGIVLFLGIVKDDAGTTVIKKVVKKVKETDSLKTELEVLEKDVSLKEIKTAIDKEKWGSAEAKLKDFLSAQKDHPVAGKYLKRVEEEIENLAIYNKVKSYHDNKKWKEAYELLNKVPKKSVYYERVMNYENIITQNHLDNLYDSAYKFFAAKQYLAAKQQIDEYLKIRQDSNRSKILLEKINEALKKPDKTDPVAKEDTKKAGQLSNKERQEKALDLRKKALNLQMAGDYSGALKLFKDALQLWPGLVEIHRNMGLIYQKTGNKQAAIAEFKLFLKLYPTSPQRPYIEELLTQLGAN